MKQVNVLISTYNGEKYIRDQIESILNQSYKNIKIFVRDDGSTDNTVSILEEYQDKGTINLIRGANLGFGGSFMTLLKNAEEGDYWAFCDQDDVWLPEKIQWAVEWLDRQDDSKPNMFHSSFYLTDEHLNVEGEYLPNEKKYTFTKAITECFHMGFSTVFNKTLRDYMLMADISKLSSHDHWAELIVMKFGNVEFDNRCASYHRRLTYSLSGTSFRARLKWLKGAMKGQSEILPVAKEFDRVFGQQINDKECKINRWFCYDKYSFIKSVKKAFYPHRWRTSFPSELVLRFLMITGRV